MIELSIIVPIYNVEQYLDKCLQTIYELTIKKEIILVNDESKDDSYLIIEKYKKLYWDETIVINQKNKGLSGARNSGLEIAKGEYVAFIDSDDFINTKEYEEFFLKGRSQKLDIIVGCYRRYKDGKYLEKCNKNDSIKNLGIVSGKEFFQKSIKFNSFYVEVWDDIYCREFLIKNNLKFKEKLLHEDILFSVQAFSKAKKVQYIDIPFYIYRQREGSITSSINKKNYQHQLWIVRELIELKTEEKTKLKGINKFLLELLWSLFKRSNYIDANLLKKLLLKDIYSPKGYVKIFIMYLFSSKNKKIESINL